MTTGSAQDSIVTFCKKCKAQLRAPSKLAGKRGKCAQCGAAITIPLVSEAPPDAAKPDAHAPAKSAPEQAPAKRINMVTFSLLAVLAGVILAVLIYVMFLMGPSGSLLPRAPLPRPAPGEPPAGSPAVAPTETAVPAKAEAPATNEPALPSIIRLGPKESAPAPKPPKATASPAPTKGWTPPNAGPQPGRPPFGPPSGRPPGKDPMRSHRSSSRMVEVSDAIDQGVLSGKVTVLPDKTVEITLKREILTPMTLLFREGTKALGGKGGFVVVSIGKNMTMDLTTSTEATLVLPLAEPTELKSVTIAPTPREEAAPHQPGGAAVR